MGTRGYIDPGERKPEKRRVYKVFQKENVQRGGLRLEDHLIVCVRSPVLPLRGSRGGILGRGGAVPGSAGGLRLGKTDTTFRGGAQGVLWGLLPHMGNQSGSRSSLEKGGDPDQKK